MERINEEAAKDALRKKLEESKQAGLQEYTKTATMHLNKCTKSDTQDPELAKKIFIEVKKKDLEKYSQWYLQATDPTELCSLLKPTDACCKNYVEPPKNMNLFADAMSAIEVRLNSNKDNLFADAMSAIELNSNKDISSYEIKGEGSKLFSISDFFYHRKTKSTDVVFDCKWNSP